MDFLKHLSSEDLLMKMCFLHSKNDIVNKACIKLAAALIFFLYYFLFFYRLTNAHFQIQPPEEINPSLAVKINPAN